uniref:Uncharacterized protein n=1 Tax=Desertifilum tharense IPPAS B-1220 TaxID=1781255 RepID=A0ACD5GV94_9CYAN
MRISQEGHVLSLDLPLAQTAANASNAEPQTLSLPQLLSGSSVHHADRIGMNQAGEVVISGSGLAIASGQLNVSGEVGGTVNVIGDRVNVVNAQIDASGTQGGGSVRIGGDYRGQGQIPNALNTFIDNNSIISADAILTGDGGNIFIWSDRNTRIDGTLTARGEVLQAMAALLKPPEKISSALAASPMLVPLMDSAAPGSSIRAIFALSAAAGVPLGKTRWMLPILTQPSIAAPTSA